MDEYEANVRAARFAPLPPEVLEARAAARDDAHAMAQFCLAWEARMPPRAPASGRLERPAAIQPTDFAE